MSSLQQLLLCNYHYDPLDRLISHAQPDAPVHQRFYCKSRLATEKQGTLLHSIVQHGDLLMAQQQRQGDSLETTLLVTDQQRSVLQTLKKNQQKQPVAYSPYGHRHAESGLTSLLGFNGERPDVVTGYYLLGNGYRAFNPVLMRFNSPDSWSPFGRGGLNSYGYCVGNPVGRTDPTGHAPLIGVVGALNSLKSHANKPVTFMGYHVGRQSSVGALQSGGEVAWSGMHRGGKLLGKGLYATESLESADAFLTRALKGYTGTERPEVFGVYTNAQPSPVIARYGPAFPSSVDPGQIAQFDQTIRFPSNQFDNLVFTGSSNPAPTAGAPTASSSTSVTQPPGGGGDRSAAAAIAARPVDARSAPVRQPEPAAATGRMAAMIAFQLPQPLIRQIRNGRLPVPAG